MFNSLVDLLAYPFEVFSELLDKTDLFEMFIGAFLIILSYRFLLRPIFSGGLSSLGGSDKAKKNNSRGGKNGYSH